MERWPVGREAIVLALYRQAGGRARKGYERVGMTNERRGRRG